MRKLLFVLGAVTGVCFLGNDCSAMTSSGIEAQRAFQACKQAADAGDLEAKVALALRYKKGDGVERNPTKAFELLKDTFELLKGAADAGRSVNKAKLASVKIQLARCYKEGIGVEQNPTEAVRLFREAADGFLTAKIFLAKCFEDGFGVERNPAEAIKLYREARYYDIANKLEAAEAGNTQAKYELAMWYKETGFVTLEPDPTAAFRLFKDAADKGHYQAIIELAKCYKEGIGVEQNPTEAFRVFKKAADNGHYHATIELAKYYRDGFGVEKNPTEAFRLAKSLGNRDSLAKALLAECYENGIGVEKNPAEAIRLYRNAGYKKEAAKLEAKIASGKF